MLGCLRSVQRDYIHNYSTILHDNSNISLKNLMVLLLKSYDCSYYARWWILAPPKLWLYKHTDLRTYDSVHSSDLQHQHWLVNFTCIWSWRLCRINPALPAIFMFLTESACMMLPQKQDSPTTRGNVIRMAS